MMQGKKKISNFISFILCTILIFSLIGCGDKKNEREKMDQYTQTDVITFLNSSITIIDSCEKQGIELDKEYVNKIKSMGNSIFNLIDEENLELDSFSKLININNILKLNQNDFINRKLEQYWNKEKQYYEIKNTNNGDSDIEDTGFDLAANIGIVNGLKEAKIEKNCDGIIDEVIRWLEINFRNANDKLYQDAFYFVSEHNKESKLSNKNIIYSMQNLSKGKIKARSNILELGEIIRACNYLKKVKLPDATETVKKFYRELKSEKDFFYSKDDSLWTLLLSDSLKECDFLKDNSYFTSNISNWLIENYNECYEETLNSIF